MFWIAIGFAVLLGLFYPFTFKIVFSQGDWRFFWLPKVFGGYARPLALRRQVDGGGEKGLLRQVLSGRLRRCRWHSLRLNVALGESRSPAAEALLGGGVYALLGALIPLLPAEACPPRLHIRFVPGQRETQVSGECIFSFRLGNSMNDGLLKMPNPAPKEKRYVRRT
ncbi:MAG: hypothetical protein K6B40_05995 [Firmicutes bacterium]|nr:hypothetical protein [Bacillota bacterium]